MNNNRLVIILVGLAVLLGGLYYYMGREKPSRFNWNRTLKHDGMQPYDLSVFFSTMRAEYPGKFDEIPANSTLREQVGRLNPELGDIYMYVGEPLYLTKTECDELETFVSQGGTVFISSPSVPKEFFRSFPSLKQAYVKGDYRLAFKPVFSNRKLASDTFSFVHLSRNRPEEHLWYFFKSGQTVVEAEDTVFNAAEGSDESVISISRVSGLGVDFIGLNHGAGKVYLHPNPVMFSNVYLTQKTGRNYLAAAMSHLPANRILYDFSAGLPKQDVFNEKPRGNMLDFIRGQKTLWHAWWLLLTGVLMFLVFGGRRKQRSIPVINPPVNHTMAFIEAIGRFYHSEKQNALVFRREWNQLQIFIRQHFRLNGISAAEHDIIRLSEKSGVSQETIRTLIGRYEKYRIFSELKADELTDINKAIGRFYQEYQNQYGKSEYRKRTAQPA